MATKHSENPSRGPAPPALAEAAIVETLERERCAEAVTLIDPELRHEMIATAAYYISEQRGFAPGHEREDWYRAEAAIDKQLPRLLSQR